MYCIKCGVEMNDGTQVCPLCNTKVYNPEYAKIEFKRTYPQYEKPTETVSTKGALFIMTVLFSLPFIMTLLCDWSITGTITWSGFAAGAILVIYICAIFPVWFKKPNPVILVPIDFAAVALYLLYICSFTDGTWFLSFALPVVGGLAVITSAVITLIKYLRKASLYIYGGAFIALGIHMVLTEFLINITFGMRIRFIWSVYPLVVFFLIGGMLIVIAICKPLRNSLKRKFFI